jgi:hypothetical protein
VKPETPDIEARPVLDERGFATLFDLWVNGRWVGSRRTVEQCEDGFRIIATSRCMRARAERGDRDFQINHSADFSKARAAGATKIT